MSFGCHYPAHCSLHLPNQILLIIFSVNIQDLKLKELFLFKCVIYLHLLGKVGVQVVIDDLGLPNEHPLRCLAAFSQIYFAFRIRFARNVEVNQVATRDRQSYSLSDAFLKFISEYCPSHKFNLKIVILLFGACE